MLEWIIGISFGLAVAVALGMVLVSDIRNKRRIAEIEKFERREFQRLTGEKMR